MIGGGGPDLSRSCSRSFFLFSRIISTTCVMFSFDDPWSPMYTYAGLRMYVFAIRSTAGGIVAENMYVCR